MRRRQVLALAAVGLTGCLSDSAPASNATATGTPTDAPEPTETPAPTDTPMTTDDTASPDLDTYPGDCPTYGASRVICASAAPDDAPLRMTASTSTVGLPGEVEFTLHNGTDVEFRSNHYAARLHKGVDGEWFRIAPNGWPQPLMLMPAGTSHAWTVALAHEADAESRGGGTDERRVGGLGGGRYAFGNHGWFAGESPEEQTAVVATFDVRAPPAELSTTGDVSGVSVAGDTLTARWTGGRDGERSYEATFVLRRADARASARLVTEPVLQPGGHPKALRDALALAVEHGVDEVRLTGRTGATQPFGVGGPSVFEYQGDAYEISAEGDGGSGA